MLTNSRALCPHIGWLVVGLGLAGSSWVGWGAAAAEERLPAGLYDEMRKSTGAVEAVVPAAWTPPQGQRVTIDFALAAQADAWLRHVVLGDPSFDSFQHAPNNPMLRGKPPYEWPVNGFLLEDPKSGDWYVYVGNYPAGYAIGPGKQPSMCTVHRSKDGGKTWDDLGPVFHDPEFRFEGDSRPSPTAPDASVVFDGGRYHMAYDWCTDRTTWENAFHPGDGADSGAAYAWADRPEGPFHRHSRPILRTSELQRGFPNERKYRRAYGTSLIRRSHDWLALVLTDSGEFYSWGIMALTAPTPQGPWSEPVLVQGIEGNRYFSPLVESFPAFVHDGYAYNPGTSVALNRDCQIICRAEIEQAHRPDAWQLYQHGTAWHADYVPHEGFGIWGQAYSGFVDSGGQFHVMFPSREWPSGVGTINFASRPWNQPLRERGFVLSGLESRSFTLVRCAYRRFELETDVAVHGNAARIVWGCQAPLGPNRHTADATLHPLCLTRQQGLELSQGHWRIVSADEQGKLSPNASGPLSERATHTVKLTVPDEGQAKLLLDGESAWSGTLPATLGPIGLLVEPHSHLSVERFVVTGSPEPAVFSYLYLEALIGAGVTINDWEVTQSPIYRYGVGAVAKAAGGRVKWNFHGRGFRLWLPKGPQLGRCELLLNGEKLAELDLYSDHERASEIVFSRDDLANAYHALVVQSAGGRLAVDSLDVIN